MKNPWQSADLMAGVIGDSISSASDYAADAAAQQAYRALKPKPKKKTVFNPFMHR